MYARFLIYIQTHPYCILWRNMFNEARTKLSYGLDYFHLAVEAIGAPLCSSRRNLRQHGSFVQLNNRWKHTKQIYLFCQQKWVSCRLVWMCGVFYVLCIFAGEWKMRGRGAVVLRGILLHDLVREGDNHAITKVFFA